MTGGREPDDQARKVENGAKRRFCAPARTPAVAGGRAGALSLRARADGLRGMRIRLGEVEAKKWSFGEKDVGMV